MRRPAAVAALLLTLSVPAAAQGTAVGDTARARAALAPSPYVPLDDAAYGLVDALLARGLLPSLSALDRPYTAAELLAAVDAAPPADSLGRVPAAWLRRLRRTASKYAPPAPAPERRELRVRAALVPFAAAQTGEERELMLAAGEGGAYPGVWVRASAAAGPVVVGFRLAGDQSLKHDARYTGKSDRAVAGRLEDGYVAAQWPLGELFFGRQARSWGPHVASGLLLGRDAFTYDHAQVRIGPRRLRLDAVVARLDDVALTPDSVAHRYLTAHRLLGRWRGLEVAASEALVYGGVDRGFEPSLANPLNVYDLAQYNEGEAGNVSYALDVALRARRLGILSAQVLLDDFQVDECTPMCQEPPSWGLTLSAEGLPTFRDHRLFASYTRVTNLAYRTPQPWERYAVLGAGLGRNFSDYDEVRAGIDLAFLEAAPLRAYVAGRRQGEGDFRLPFPPPEEYEATPEFLAGVVTHVTRFGVSASGATGWAELTGDVGYNRVRNAGHVEGRSEGGFEGRVRVSLETPWVLLGRAAP
ncbi:MAG: hypothetical protein ACJ8AO_16460 [Gemmatimonadaceae bacterium]